MNKINEADGEYGHFGSSAKELGSNEPSKPAPALFQVTREIEGDIQLMNERLDRTEGTIDSIAHAIRRMTGMYPSPEMPDKLTDSEQTKGVDVADNALTDLRRLREPAINTADRIARINENLSACVHAIEKVV
tara:strand:+ start:2782 stop:3180 length:399 start_codon:yes stop_codon:yes gene_type:complete